MVQSDKPEHAIPARGEDQRGIVNATLHFKNSKDFEKIYLNKYDLQWKAAGSDETKKQTFYINNPGTIPLREACNMLDGPPVLKTLANQKGEKYETWLQFDFTKMKDGQFEMAKVNPRKFDADKVLANYPFEEKGNPDKLNEIKQAWAKGNLANVTVIKNGQAHSFQTSPNLGTGTINVYDMNKQRVSYESLFEKPEKQKQTNKQTNKQTAGTDGEQPQRKRQKQKMP